jgi:RNA-dependent RNA polymerase
LGEFALISPYAKMAARIGQAFSSSWSYIFKQPPEVVPIEDLRDPSGKLYTDGIGKISEDLINDMCQKLKVKDLSVVQIRYKGAKGLLALDPTLPPNTVCLRPSMVKYECPHTNSDRYLDILSWNMYKGGYLNRQIIILLKTRGVPDSVFMSIQQRYIGDIKQMTFRECTVFKEMTDPEVDETLYNL